MAKAIKKQEIWEGFIQHGVDFTHTEDSKQFQGICPFCNKEKFYCNPVSLLWDCKVCIKSGNFQQFLARRMPMYQGALHAHALPLAKSRGIKPQTFDLWGIGYDDSTDTYMLPVDGNYERKLTDIQRYTIGNRCYSTKSASPSLIAPRNIYNSKRVWVCEGIWDAMAWYEILHSIGIKEDVFAAPGAGNFPKDLATWFSGKDVVVLFDFDEAGFKGSTRTGNLLSGIANSVKYLVWQTDINIEDEYDIRELYKGIHKVKGTPTPCNKSCDLHALHRKPKDIYDYILSRLSNTAPSATKVNEPVDENKPVYSGKGVDYKDVLTRYQKWLQLNNPEVLDVLYGAAFANRINVDPLWLFMVAAPGGSKTELLMSLSDASGMASTTSLTPPALISGCNSGNGDPSLIPKLNGKTLIVKDFTTILNMNQTSRDEIFGILRDCYDGKTEKYFGNGVHRKYVSKFGILAGVTPAIEGYASMNGVLGERFIKYKIKQDGKIRVAEDVVLRAIMAITHENTMRDELKAIGNEVLSREIQPTDIPIIQELEAKKVRDLAMLVASLRGVVSREKYTGQVTYKPVAEIGTRLGKQFMTLAIGIAIYRNSKVIDNEILQIIYQVAKDTAPDRVEEIVKQLYIHQYNRVGTGEYPALEISEWCKFPQQTIAYILEDLYMLHIVEKVIPLRGTKFWKLTDNMMNIINSIGLYQKELKTKSKVPLQVKGK